MARRIVMGYSRDSVKSDYSDSYESYSDDVLNKLSSKSKAWLLAFLDPRNITRHPPSDRLANKLNKRKK